MERHLVMKTLQTLAFLSTLATTTLVRAEDLPKPIADLERFVGTWKGTGTVTMGKDTAKITAQMACKRTSGKAGVSCVTRMTGIPGMAAYEETDLFGYEPGTNTYHWFAVTNAGETHDHVAKASDEAKLQFVHTGTQEAKPFKEVNDLEFGKDGKTMSVRSEVFVAGASAALFEIKVKK